MSSVVNEYTMTELSEKFNVTKRTIYYYSSIGLLPPANKRGPHSRYSEEFAQKLEEVLQYRNKVRLAAIPYLTHTKFNVMKNPTVLTLFFESSNVDFLKYAHNALLSKIKKLRVQQSELCNEHAQQSMIVAFPVTDIAFDEIKKEIDSVRDASRSYNGGVHFKTKLSEDNFVPDLGNAING